MDYCSIVVYALAICYAVMNLRCLEMVLMKQTPLINMMYPTSVSSLYLSRMVNGMGKISFLMCGVFVLGSFLLGIQDSFPKFLQFL